MPELCQTSAFYLPDGDFSRGRWVVFDPGESGHIARVLRLAAGDLVEVLDGRGGIHRVELSEIKPRRVEGRVVESRAEQEQLPRISAAVAAGRKERLRFAVEKLAELGCRRFWPLDCEYLQFPGSLGAQTAKLQATAVAALKQSRQPYLTAVGRPLDLAELLKLCREQKLEPVVCHPGASAAAGLDSWASGARRDREYVLVVGPEGGFSPRELELLETSGHCRLDLGSHRLRSETAAVAGFTLLAACLRKEFSITSHPGGEN